MATYAEIEEWIRERYGWRPKTCWIAHCKEIAGLDRRDAPNRRGRDRLVPCPREKREAIIQAFRHFKMLIMLIVIGTLANPVGAPEATASLERVEAGGVDAPDECEFEPCRESRRVCLNGGAFVLAVQMHHDSRRAAAAVTTERSEDAADEESGETPAWRFFGWYPGDALLVQAVAFEDKRIQAPLAAAAAKPRARRRRST